MNKLPSGRAWALCGLALGLLALALRLVNGAFGSLKLDDFHSLHHARAPDLRAFFASLVQDNHPPLALLLVRASRALLGEGPFALRLPALLAGLGTLALVWRLGARLGAPHARAAAAFLMAVSSLHVELSSDVRMYAALSLASAGLLAALLELLEDGRRAWEVALWSAVGLHVHYHFLYALAALGAAALALTLLKAAYRPRRGALLAAFAVAAALSVPWYALGFPRQLAHELAPGGSDASGLRLFEGWKNLVFLDVSAAGPLLRLPLLAAGGLLLALAALGALGLVRAARSSARPALAALALAGAFGIPILTWAGAHASARAGFEWRYLAGALPAFALVVATEAAADGRGARARRAAVGLLAGAALVLAGFTARDPGEENYRGAAAWLLARATPQDAVVAADWQPRLFPHAIGWRYYATRSGRPLPVTLEHTDDFALADPTAAERHARVFCFLRSLPRNCALLQALRASHPTEEVHAFGRSVYVHVFTRPTDRPKASGAPLGPTGPR